MRHRAGLVEVLSCIRRGLRRMLGGRRGMVEATRFEGGEQAWVGKPASYPRKVVEVLRRCLEGISTVRAAYLGQVWMGDKPELAVAVDAESPVAELAEACTNALAQEMAEPPPINYMEVGSTRGAAVVRATEPFYVRDGR